MRQIFLDTETTGLAADKGDRIIEIGCIELVNRRPSGRSFHRYLNPQRSSHPDAVRVHGITDDFLQDKPLFAEVADELIEFLAGAEVIAHNMDFDRGFIDAELERVGKPRLAEIAAQVSDSLALARELYPGKRNSLDALCARLEVDNSKRDYHGALLDAGLLAEVYLAMTRGQDSLVVDEAEPGTGGKLAVAAVDLSRLALPVLQPSDTERAAHEALLDGLARDCKRGALWREVCVPAESPAAESSGLVAAAVSAAGA